jgi:SAM-dependent methyltransferase
MSSTDEALANAEQREFWAKEGELWVRDADRFDAMNAAFGAEMLDAAALQPGERVLDVGCGNGATTLEAARRVTGTGAVLGVDLSTPMLALARRRARDNGFDNVEFREADAQVEPFADGRFDAIISRFGTMFFADPQAAFTNLARALRPRGRLAMVCWQDIMFSEWIVVPGMAAAAHVGLPDFGPPGAPGPFAFADGDRLAGMLRAAGFTDVKLDAITRSMRIGDDIDDVAGFITSLELVKQLFADKPEENVSAAIAAARDALEPYAGPDGVVMNGGAWLVTAGALTSPRQR